MIGFFLGTSIGRAILIAGGVLVAAGLAYLWIYHSAYAAGAASVLAAATAESLRRTAQAQKARAEVKPNDQGAMDADPNNRDRK